MLILGIETSCDETAAAVVADGVETLSNVVASQDTLHGPYGGVVPEIAARAQLESIVPVIDQALRSAAVTPQKIDGVAVTNTPGLIGALLIGVTAAKTFSWFHRKPLVAVNHLHAHIYSCALGRSSAVAPCASMVISGGHTSIYHTLGPLSHELMGATQDDAAGEAFDKVAAILGLGYPGGPEIDRAARSGDPSAVRFPRTWLDADSLDFSFSGLKTAVLYHCRGQDSSMKDRRPLAERERADVAASFQEAVVDILVGKAFRAVERLNARRLAVGGGVARNARLRERLSQTAAGGGVELLLPDDSFCIDNGAMVAGLGYHALADGRSQTLDFDAFPRHPDSRAPYKREEK